MNRIIWTGLALVLVAASSSRASEDVAEVQKRQSFRRFIVSAGAEAQYNQMIEIFLANFRKGFESGLKRSLSEIDGKEQETVNEAAAIATEAVDGFVSRFKEGLVKVAPFPELIDQVYYPVFAAQFTTAEFDTLAQFYESDVGKKYASQSALLMQQSATLFNEKYGERVQEFSLSLAKSQWDTVQERLKTLKEQR